MKNIAFALCLALGATLALHSFDAFSAENGESSARRLHKPHKRSKQPAIQRERIYQPADLWVRLRKGIALPKPTPVEPPTTLVSQAFDQNLPIWPSGDIGDSNSKLLDFFGSISIFFKSPLALTAGTNSALSAAITPKAFSIPGGIAARAGGDAPFEINVAMEERMRDYQRQVQNYESQADQAEDLKMQQEIYQRFSKQLNWYLQRTGFVQRALERARPYLYLIIEELEKQKLPLDLALLPILESGYQPLAESAKQASGIWQFIPSTGEIYGLKQNDWYDGRLDIAASTHAAATYLAHLQRRFKGDFLLALASYNCGEGRVEKAMAANRASGLTTDFWSLDLPEETKYYVPRMLALSAIIGDPSTYKLKLKPIPNRPYLAKIRLEQFMTVAEASRLANLSIEKFVYLNPGFTNGEIGYDGPYDLLLPQRNAEEFNQQLNALMNPPEPDMPFVDTTGNSSNRTPFNTQIDQADPGFMAAMIAGPDQNIIRLNDELSGFNISLSDAGTSKSAPSQKLGPQQTTNLKPAQKSISLKASSKDIYYIHAVSDGETIDKISAYYNLSPQLIRSANKLKRRKQPAVGQNLTIPLEQADPVDLLADKNPEKPNDKLAITPASQFKSVDEGPRALLKNGTQRSLQRSSGLRVYAERSR